MIAPKDVPVGPLTWRGLPTGLVGSQLLDESQNRWSSSGSGREARHAQSPTKFDEILSELLDFSPVLQCVEWWANLRGRDVEDPWANGNH